MLKLQTEIEGKKAYFGHMQDMFGQLGYAFGGNWDYHKGKFDAILWREKGETIYLRVPFYVLHGELDHREAYIEFKQPYVIKHVVNIGLDTDENSLISATGFNQFQEPLDTDGQIIDKSKWELEGEQAIQHAVESIDYIYTK